MTAPVAPPLLRIPPFPNSVARPLARPGDQRGVPRSDDEVHSIVEALGQAQVGGTYWAAQPPVPDGPYTLLRLVEPKVLTQAIASLSSDRPILSWSVSTPRKASEAQPQLHFISGILDPWHLIKGATEVIVDSDDELALIAAIAGVPVRCVGNGRFEALETGGAPAVLDAVRQVAIQRLHYADPFTGEAMELVDAIRLCAFWRELIDYNRDITAAVGFAFWKRPTVAPLLWGGTSPVPFVAEPRAMALGGQIAIWKSRVDPGILAQLIGSDAQLIEVEDGFIRSTGLGADCVPPLSIIVDKLGVYFDPGRPSELERLLQDGEFPPAILDRARRLRTLIVELGVSKYGTGVSSLERRRHGVRYLLVPGQVEDDRSVMSGGGGVRTNLHLLRRVRENNPDAYILYKPHPDVEAGHRRGLISNDLCLSLADEVVRTSPISSLIDLVDEVHVNTSLAGFEALLRGKPVTTYGVPFYAGWGLTHDLGAVPPRRTSRQSLDELVAATLLLYPRYLDPVTGLPCPPEILIRRLSDGGVGRTDGPVVWLRRLQGRANRVLSKIGSR